MKDDNEDEIENNEAFNKFILASAKSNNIKGLEKIFQ